MSINGFGHGFGQQFQPESNVGATTYLHGPGMTTEYSSHTGGFTLTNTPNNMTGPDPYARNPAFNTGGFPQPNFAGFGLGQQPQGLNNFNGNPFGLPNTIPNPATFGSPFVAQGIPNPAYPQPNPVYPQPTSGFPTYPPQQNNGSGLQAILAPIMQLFTMMIGTFMQNGSFIGGGFEGDIDYYGHADNSYYNLESREAINTMNKVHGDPLVTPINNQ